MGGRFEEKRRKSPFPTSWGNSLSRRQAGIIDPPVELLVQRSQPRSRKFSEEQCLRKRKPANQILQFLVGNRPSSGEISE